MNKNNVITVYTDELTTIKEATKLLGVTKKTIHAWILNGKLTRIKLGHNAYLILDEVERIKGVREQK